MPVKAATQHIGLFGGSFDPVHCGHLIAAQSVRRQLLLDELLFLPAAQSPFKPRPQSADADRMAMLELALSGCPGLSIDARELQAPGPSYSIDTLRAISAEQPDRHYYLIMGMDAWQEFERWHSWEEILHLSHLVVVTRPDYLEPVLSDAWRVRRAESVARIRDRKAGRLLFLQVPASSAASREIREEIKKGLAADDALPDSVEAYIRDRRLYR